MTSHVASALVEKRAELAGLVQQAEADLRKLRLALEHVDGTLKLYDPAMKPELIGAKRVSGRPPILPDLGRRILELLRSAGAPMTTHDIAMQIAAAHQIGATDFGWLERAVGAYMVRAEGRLIERANRRKRPARWKLMD